MHKSDGLSATHEMYLKIIHQLEAAGDPARVGQMAKGLGVQPSTVSAVVRTLDRMGLVTHDRYGAVKLTEVGNRLAACVVRRYEILQRFLVELLGIDEESAAVEACEMEHVVSPLAIARIDQLVQRMCDQEFQPLTALPVEQFDACQDCIVAGECSAAQQATSHQ